MAKNTLRFCITSGEKVASIWNISASKNRPEVYLSTRNLGTIHVSFHGSGKWHIKHGDIEEKRRINLSEDKVVDAYLTKWDRPKPAKPHVTAAYRIITPWGTPQPPRRSNKKKTISIPNASKNNAIEIMICFLEANTKLKIKNATLVGFLNLPNGEKVFIVYKEIPFDQNQIRLPQQIPDFSSRVTLSDLFFGNTGLFVFGKSADESRIMWDCAIKIKPRTYAKIIYRKLKTAVSNPLS